MSALADVLASMGGTPAVTMRDAVTTATAGVVDVAGAHVAVSRWVNQPPAGAGQRVVLLMQGGTAVAVGTGLTQTAADARYVRLAGFPMRTNSAVVTFNFDGTWHRANLSGWGLTSIGSASFTPWALGEAYSISVVDSSPTNFGLGIWRGTVKVTTSINISTTIWGT